MRTYYVYIMASCSRVLYTGVTNDLARRVDEHKRSLTPGFTSRYHITRLVYFEDFGDGVAHMAKVFEVNESSDVVPTREAGGEAALVLIHASREIVGDARV